MRKHRRTAYLYFLMVLFFSGIAACTIGDNSSGTEEMENFDHYDTITTDGKAYRISIPQDWLEQERTEDRSNLAYSFECDPTKNLYCPAFVYGIVKSRDIDMPDLNEISMVEMQDLLDKQLSKSFDDYHINTIEVEEEGGAKTFIVDYTGSRDGVEMHCIGGLEQLDAEHMLSFNGLTMESDSAENSRYMEIYRSVLLSRKKID